MSRQWRLGNISVLCLVFANVLIPVAVLTFATGFFPYKPFIPGLAVLEDLEYGVAPAAPFDKVVFMVVDALRSDFVYSRSSGFKFTQSLIRTGEALPFTAHAAAPTITMPRVKAITTGSIPSFLDVILNFAESDTTSTLASQDTWLAQIKDKLGRKGHPNDQFHDGQNGRLIMYGDDTWLKLFPGMFTRADGTSSFFVSDFTEVDNNVTRHVPSELRVDDWDAMILHYLGLDHIGHKAGPSSPNMIPKQVEMDGIVQQIYEAMTTMHHLNSTLLVLCGDHGMNDGGNHGGSAPGETSPALVFMSPIFKDVFKGRESPVEAERDFEFYSMVEQSDIAPTIAGLLGLPVPTNNLGIFIADLMPMWKNSTDRLQLVLRNARQMLKIVKATFPNFQSSKVVSDDATQDEASELSLIWRDALQTLQNLEVHAQHSDIRLIIDKLYDFCRKSQQLMSNTASNYDVGRLLLGIALSAFSLLFGLYAAWQLLDFDSDGALFCLTTILYAFMMFASSFVEEEQHFWYWVSGGWLAYLMCFKSSEPSSKVTYLLILALHRIAIRWNQTGQKFAGASDIVHGVLIHNPTLSWALVLMTYGFVLFQTGHHFVRDLGSHAFIGTACSLALVVPALLFKLGFTANEAPELLSGLSNAALQILQRVPLVGSARVVFLTLGSETLWAFSAAANDKESVRARHKLPRTLVPLLTLLLITQSRVLNTPIFLIYSLQHLLLSRLSLTHMQITLTALLFGHSSYFALGNSNAISSIDLSNAYNGVSGYNVLAVGVLVFLSNWAGPVWWSITGVSLLVQKCRPDSTVLANEEHGAKRRAWIQAEMDHLLVNKKRDKPSSSWDRGKCSAFTQHVVVLTLFASTSSLSVMVACTALRTHLFIWTVFSPKYLYCMAWSIAFHVVISLTLGRIIWTFCTSAR